MSVLFVDGWFGPDPGDWQELWIAGGLDGRRFAQDDWDRPVRDEWVSRLDSELALCREAPVVVAHSLGVLTVLHWLSTGSAQRVAGALLVCPADIESNPQPDIIGFDPIPRIGLPFPAIVAASADDHWMTPQRAAGFAEAWGADLRNAGPVGHLTAAGGYGPWPEGRKLLAELIGAL
ncbi:alpha/beta hydrolase [Pseudonocardiaceae bacterium YIM PH 21723]|nr:alpha/beta hydrolase [Pseudonocardiaceae bacterium YIM PH 21723]